MVDMESIIIEKIRKGRIELRKKHIGEKEYDVVFLNDQPIYVLLNTTTDKIIAEALKNPQKGIETLQEILQEWREVGLDIQFSTFQKCILAKVPDVLIAYRIL